MTVRRVKPDGSSVSFSEVTDYILIECVTGQYVADGSRTVVIQNGKQHPNPHAGQSHVRRDSEKVDRCADREFKCKRSTQGRFMRSCNQRFQVENEFGIREPRAADSCVRAEHSQIRFLVSPQRHMRVSAKICSSWIDCSLPSGVAPSQGTVTRIPEATRTQKASVVFEHKLEEKSDQWEKPTGAVFVAPTRNNCRRRSAASAAQ
jgi:hypothetical protein